MTYPAATAPVVTGYPPAYAPPTPYGTAPGMLPPPPAAPQPGPPPPVPPAPRPAPARGARRPGLGRFAVLVVAILLAGVLGGVAGAVITAQSSDRGTAASSGAPAPAAPSAETIRAQNIQLCTAYATINSAMPKPARNALEVLPAANGLRLALSDYPAASPEIRQAISDVVAQFDGMMAAFGKVRTRGLAEPPTYDVDRAQQVSDRAWDVCQLG